MKFYDPKDEADLARVEAVLHRGAIEYSVMQPRGTGSVAEIDVAEEDVPKAEELLLEAKRG